MSDAQTDFEEQVKIKAITWDEVSQKVTSALKREEWKRAILQELGNFDTYRPLADCPFYGKIENNQIIQCMKGSKNGTISGSSNTRSRSIRSNRRNGGINICGEQICRICQKS